MTEQVAVYPPVKASPEGRGGTRQGDGEGDSDLSIKNQPAEYAPHQSTLKTLHCQYVPGAVQFVTALPRSVSAHSYNS